VPSESVSVTTQPTVSPEAESTAGEEDLVDESVPAWVWLLVAGLLFAAAVLGGVLMARARRRRRWKERLHSAEAEVAWFARELLPQLRAAGTLERAAGGWQVSRPRVIALDDQLTVLEASAKADGDANRALALRDAARQATARIDGLTSAEIQGPWVLDMDEAIALLESALAPSQRAQR
jgi:hypothetical protein